MLVFFLVSFDLVFFRPIFTVLYFYNGLASLWLLSFVVLDLKRQNTSWLFSREKGLVACSNFNLIEIHSPFSVIVGQSEPCGVTKQRFSFFFPSKFSSCMYVKKANLTYFIVIPGIIQCLLLFPKQITLSLFLNLSPPIFCSP